MRDCNAKKTKQNKTKQLEERMRICFEMIDLKEQINGTAIKRKEKQMQEKG